MTDSNIIKVGDLVRILNPQIFVRCGYPLCIKDVAESLDNSIAIDAIKRAISILPDKHLHISYRLERAVRDINRGLALAVMIHKGFGGSERKIYTREDLNFKDKIVKVESKRQVVTGVRYPGCGPGYYGDEAEGPSLENQQRHTLISFWPAYRDEYGNFSGGFVVDTKDNLEIEQIHVEKIERMERS